MERGDAWRVRLDWDALPNLHQNSRNTNTPGADMNKGDDK
jgi:hypothetical protein